MLGTRAIKLWSATQELIALSSGEAEYYGLVKASAWGRGARSMMLGVTTGVQVLSDASSAIGIANRRWLGEAY